MVVLLLLWVVEVVLVLTGSLSISASRKFISNIWWNQLRALFFFHTSPE
jgi:succinate dehydrogenase hydrophobic anchor subunit